MPLGQDRQQRRYWWGLAGHRPVVWVEDGEVRARLGCGFWGPSLAFAWAPPCMLRVPAPHERQGHRFDRSSRLLIVFCSPSSAVPLQGRWGAHSSLAELDALVASLDRRGVRELDLAEVRPAARA